jgi:hypothetical protein
LLICPVSPIAVRYKYPAHINTIAKIEVPKIIQNLIILFAIVIKAGKVQSPLTPPFIGEGSQGMMIAE